MLSLEEALQRILAQLPPPTVAPLPPSAAAGRFLAAPAEAQVDVPPFDNSAMDGFAVRSADISRASPQTPAALRLIGEAAAGRVFAGEATAGTCVRVSTGSPLPRGADAVVMQEDTRAEPAQPGTVFILDAARPWENVRFRGEDVKRGSALASPGARLDAGLIALLAATGCETVAAAVPPRVGLLATGDELRDPGQPLGPGQIFESNRAMLRPLVAETGAVPAAFPVAPDTLGATTAALRSALETCDIVITCGGASVGEHDHVKDAFAALGGALDFWRVAIKPGKPFIFGRLGRTFLFGLPGNPVSAFVTFLLLVRPALLRWQGAAEIRIPSHPAVLAEPLANRGDRRHFVRVCVDAAGSVTSAGAQASHRLGSLAAANGLVDVPPGTTLAAGATVHVLRFRF
ncbi:MAG: molybdopterin molybdotransferase MoeA [Verrucomicrobia bacterium]|nr:molybdopterin molybdotransferase MoeA [Verrucomicrobiota bacterium]